MAIFICILLVVINLGTWWRLSTFSRKQRLVILIFTNSLLALGYYLDSTFLIKIIIGILTLIYLIYELFLRDKK